MLDNILVKVKSLGVAPCFKVGFTVGFQPYFPYLCGHTAPSWTLSITVTMAPKKETRITWASFVLLWHSGPKHNNCRTCRTKGWGVRLNFNNVSWKHADTSWEHKQTWWRNFSDSLYFITTVGMCFPVLYILYSVYSLDLFESEIKF